MPCELLWGQWESTTEKPAADREVDSQDMLHHFAFTDLLRSQGYADTLAEATCRKTQFDSKVCLTDFQVGDYVQVYNSRLDATYEAKAKLLPRWSPPRIITGCLLNSYTLCRPDGTELNGTFHMRRLCKYAQQQEGPPDQLEAEMTEDDDETIEAIQGLWEEQDATRACVI